jgi:hypothetical protein
MPKLTSGFGNFATGQTLTADALNSHVTGASPLPDFIAGQDPLTAIENDDTFLVNDVSVPQVKKITLANIAAALPATTASSLTVNGNATVTGTLTNTAGMTTSTLTTSSTATIGGTLTASGNVVVNGNTTLGNASGDSITLNGTLAGTLQGEPIVNLAATSDSYGDSILISDVSNSGRLKMVLGCLPKAWACISIRDADVTTVTAVVSRTALSNVATVTKTDHGLSVGDVIYLNGDTGSIVDGWYDVKTTPTSSTFTVQTAATTAIDAKGVSWYKLTVNGGGVSSAFKSSVSSNVAQINLISTMANTNYAIVATFSRDVSPEYGTTSFNYIGATGFDKTTRSFSISTRYTTTAVNEGSIMFTVFGDLA